MQTRNRRHGASGSCFLALFLCLTAGCGEPESGRCGILVERVNPGFAAERAGIRPGDRLLRWERAAAPPASTRPARGRLCSTFDLDEAEIEQAPRGRLTLFVERNGESLSVPMPPGEWKLRIRPELPQEHLPEFLEGKRLIEAQEPQRGIELWRGLATRLADAGDHRTACRLYMEIGSSHLNARRWDEAHAACAAGLREARSSGDVRLRAALLALDGDALLGQGDSLQSEKVFRELLQITGLAAPESLAVALYLHRLAWLAWIRQDLAEAEDFDRRALRLRERLAPGSLVASQSLNRLGFIAGRRGDLGAAEEFHEAALAIQQRLDPEGSAVTVSLGHLGMLAAERGDLEAAEKFLLRALRLLEKDTTANFKLLANVLKPLGMMALKRGDLDTAERTYRSALEIFERVRPEGHVVADSLGGLGSVALERGDLESADRLHRRALAIRRHLAPGSASEAETLHALGQIARRQGQPAAAADFFGQAVEALEAQTGRLGGTEDVRSGFMAGYKDYFWEALDLLIEMGRPQAAFQVMERSRARILLSMLAERDLVLTDGIPEELARQQRLAAVELDRTEAKLRGLSPGTDGEQIERLLGRLRELRDQQRHIARQVRKLSPRLADLRDPRPLDLAGVQASLDPGTLLLSYGVGKDRTHLFAVLGARGTDAPQFEVYTLPVGAEALGLEVQALRSLVSIQPAGPRTRAALESRSRRLFDLLLGPAQRLLASADRLLVCPDGALYSLPFAALARPEGGFLVEGIPLHVVTSGTLYAELRGARPAAARKGPSLQLVAFGDPSYPQSLAQAGTDPQLHSFLARGYALEPLPATRNEVEAITSLYGSSAARYLGPEATEERVKSAGGTARYLHIASHALLDERFPLDSALALSIPEQPRPGQDNGLLQVWEIFEKLRLDAELVTLSACDTALGRDMGGEGLIGLTRAFQYAGARSVLASLWKVPDVSTAELMRRFYGHLEAGLSKDEALRQAQLALLRSGPEGLSDPLYWAGFVLAGDWK